MRVASLASATGASRRFSCREGVGSPATIVTWGVRAMLSPTLGHNAGAYAARIVLLAIALSLTGCTGSSGASGSGGGQVNRTSGHDTQRDGGGGMDHGSNGGGRY